MEFTPHKRPKPAPTPDYRRQLQRVRKQLQRVHDRVRLSESAVAQYEQLQDDYDSLQTQHSASVDRLADAIALSMQAEQRAARWAVAAAPVLALQRAVPWTDERCRLVDVLALCSPDPPEALAATIRQSVPLLVDERLTVARDALPRLVLAHTAFEEVTCGVLHLLSAQ